MNRRLIIVLVVLVVIAITGAVGTAITDGIGAAAIAILKGIIFGLLLVAVCSFIERGDR